MTSRLSRLLIGALLIVSLLLRSPLLLLLDVLLLLVAAASALWGRYCLAGVSYRRQFEADRLFCGEQVQLWVEIVNAKPLPLAWLKVEDEFPEDFAVERTELSSASKDHRRTLTNLLSLRWYERVRRRYRLTAQRRGAYEFGPARLASGDIFGFQTRLREQTETHTLLVYPRLVTVEELRLRLARPAGEEAATRRIVEDPLRLAGVRDYSPGDSIRHIHWKSTAHQGRLQTKVFEPGASQHLIVCVNGQTLEHAYEGVLGAHFETVLMAAASLANAALDRCQPVGLFTNNSARDASHRVRLPATRHATQLTRILETLAQLTHFTLMPFDQLLRLEATTLPFGASVVAVSALATEAIQSALLALHDAGHPATLVLIAAPGRVPATSLPAAIPVYVVTQDWTELEALELG
ncbi:MAG: DUF58 domain-containing protein [Anaerolineales bacterium]|nr:DUF58 domain-containing protein [Anaerolineales bacterium]